MGFSIRTNVASLGAQRNMSQANMSLQKSMEKLSSGFRINRAGDDAAGLAISEKLKAQVQGLNQASRNALDGISMVQTAEAGLDEIQSIMQRMRELGVQASNDTLGTSERSAINNELGELRTEIGNISNRTTFNGRGLLNGSMSGVSNGTSSEVKVGTALTTGGSTASVTSVDVTKAAAGRTFSFSAYNATTDQLTLTDGTTSSTVTLAATAANTTQTLDFSALGVKVTVAASNGGKTADDLGADLTTASFNNITAGTSSAAAALQTGAYQNEETQINFLNVDVESSAASTEIAALKTALTSYDTTQSQDNASALITASENALNYISSQRATLGAAQNRLEHTISNVKAASENLSASNSRIRDVDVAEESSNMAKTNILLQAGVSVLSQANQMQQLSLKLLG